MQSCRTHSTISGMRLRFSRAAASAARERLEAAARGRENLVPLVIDCVERDVTLGEICETFAGVFGEYEESEHY